MTLIDSNSTVVYEVALCEHPLVVGEDDERSDEELIQDVEERTEVADDMEWPDWIVNETPEDDMETIRMVNTAKRIHVRAPYDADPFGPITERLTIEDFDVDDMAMSCYNPTHEDDFEGIIHLDLVE